MTAKQSSTHSFTILVVETSGSPGGKRSVSRTVMVEDTGTHVVVKVDGHVAIDHVQEDEWGASGTYTLSQVEVTAARTPLFGLSVWLKDVEGNEGGITIRPGGEVVATGGARLK